MNWDYKVTRIKRGEDEALKKFGLEGWELVSVIPNGNYEYVDIYLKKRIE